MDNYYEQLNNAMGGDAIALPFAAVYFRWQRGNPQISADLGCGASHFGGWMSDAAAAAESGIELPPWLSLEYFTYSDGGQKEVWATRFLHVAFIGKRSRWETDPQSGRQRSHVQYLAYTANYNHETKLFEPWQPVVLTAKGLNTKHLNNAINQWAKITANERMNGYPAWVYWCTIGTFGQFYKLPAGQSYITPPRLIYDPKKISREYVAARYVGDELGKTMIELAEAAQDWLAAWKKESDSDADAPVPAPAPTKAAQRWLPEAPTEDDSFPF